MTAPGSDYRGEFRYVLYAPSGLYEATRDFYGRLLDLPVAGGFVGGTYFAASTGVIEVIDQDTDDSGLPELVLRGASHYEAPRGGFLLFEVPDVDALADHVTELGVTLLQELRNWPWQFRDFKVIDPCGTIVSPFSRISGWEPFHGEDREEKAPPSA